MMTSGSSKNRTAPPAHPQRLGAQYLGGGRCRFVVWAPQAKTMEVHLTFPQDRYFSLAASEFGYWELVVENVFPDGRYFFRIDGVDEFPDPASRHQPDGVHEASAICEESFVWKDKAWQGVELRDYIIYELHVGTFTSEGTFEAIIPRLPELKGLGITVLELMPIAQFPGKRNWGYDGVYLFAPQASYGGVVGLKRLVDACHILGMAVILDVVYNHLGPEGNYLSQFGPYFSQIYRTPWGAALNFDGPDSEPVRHFFLSNALTWLEEYHLDGLRLDAVHAIRDFSARPFLGQMAEVLKETAEMLGRTFYLIAENDLNDIRYVHSVKSGGMGMDSQWSDDFHHALHVVLTGEQSGYYQDYGGMQMLARAFKQGVVYQGDYSIHRRHCRGNPPEGAIPTQFVVCVQNHDQVGNRMSGDRLGRHLSFSSLKVAAASYLLAPFVPMIFMGEEYGEEAPFLFFTDYGDEGLKESVTQGRKQEMYDLGWIGEVPDPQAESSFRDSQLNWELWKTGDSALLRDFYRELIRLRRELPFKADGYPEEFEVWSAEKERLMTVVVGNGKKRFWLIFCYSETPVSGRWQIPAGLWVKLLDSHDPKWGGEVGGKEREIVTGGVEKVYSFSGCAVRVYESMEPSETG